MKKAPIALVIALILNSVCTLAQQDAARTPKQFSDSYDAYVRNTMARIPDIPGVAIVVIKDDKAIFVRGYGMADKETGTKADADTLFYIASSTKSFTALAAALLDKEGKIKLSDPMTKYASGMAFKTPMPDKITIRDLLVHTSGLTNDPLTFRMAYSGESDAKEIARVFADGTSFVDANFGKYKYDNLGYNIYGVLLQNHLNAKWQDVLQERIFDPLGMKHTTAYISRARSKKWAVAAPYVISHQDGKIVRSPLAKKDNNLQSAGGMFASISDIGKWLNMNMNGGKLNGKQVFPADIIRAAHTGYTRTVRDAPPFNGDGEYGLGWQIGRYKGEEVIYHHGGFPGYRSHISFLPDKKIAVAVLVNEGNAGGRAADMLATYAYDSWLGETNVEADYAKRLQELVDANERAKQRAMASFAERAKRTSQLTKPLGDYTGKYVNELFGTIQVTSNGNALVVKMGNIEVASTAFTAPETIRVEMIPGMGEVIKFNNNPLDKVESLTYDGNKFIKVQS